MARRRYISLRFPLLVWILALFKNDLATTEIPIHYFCALANYDYFNLTAGSWVLQLNETRCLPQSPVTIPTAQTDCKLRIKFCDELNLGDPCQNSSVCQQSSQGLLNFGGYTPQPFNTEVPLPHGVDGFRANFPEGSAYLTNTNASCKLQTVMAFRCNHSAHWDVSSALPVTPQKVPDPKGFFYNDSNCQLKITFDYAGACRWDTSSGNNLSLGTLLIIIFFIIVFLYFVVGAMLSSIKGHSGLQLIPHSQFWTSLPGYIKDGCLFACFCQKRSGSDTYSQI